jgi:lysophospholipase L1-like esterase
MGQTITKWKAKYTSVDYIFIGDSNAGGCRNWGRMIDANYFNTCNLAGDGYITKQVEAQAEKAVLFHPSYCVILSGTNDVFNISDSLYSIYSFTTCYEKMITFLEQKKIRPIVTLIPYQTKTTYISLISEMNAIIIGLCLKHHVEFVDLNETICPHKVLLKEYTVDGIHFTEKAYRVWGYKLKRVLEKKEANNYEYYNL